MTLIKRRRKAAYVLDKANHKQRLLLYGCNILYLYAVNVKKNPKEDTLNLKGSLDDILKLAVKEEKNSKKVKKVGSKKKI